MAETRHSGAEAWTVRGWPDRGNRDWPLLYRQNSGVHKLHHSSKNKTLFNDSATNGMVIRLKHVESQYRNVR